MHDGGTLHDWLRNRDVAASGDFAGWLRQVRLLEMTTCLAARLAPMLGLSDFMVSLGRAIRLLMGLMGTEMLELRIQVGKRVSYNEIPFTSLILPAGIIKSAVSHTEV